jgi:hypothetical protein
MELYWICHYQYPAKFLSIDYKDFQQTSDCWDNIGRSCNWWYPYENICFISDRPKEIHKKGIFLHNTDGPALSFRDGYSLWFLNGVDVGEKIVSAPPERLDAKLILTEKNAEVRREIVRKIGVERVCQKLGAKVLNKQDNYELISLELGDGRNRPYLKMINPSTSTYHIEGVSPEIKTVEQALNWRNQSNEKPVLLT